MKIKTKHILLWVPVILWMALIFYLSAQTAGESGGLSEAIVRWFLGVVYGDFDALPLERQMKILEIFHLIIRKGAHFTEYAILAMLVANAIRPYPFPSRPKWFLPVAFSALYAVSDEIHQYFVPGRACWLLDVGIDTCGAIFGVIIFSLGIYMIKRVKNTAP